MGAKELYLKSSTLHHLPAFSFMVYFDGDYTLEEWINNFIIYLFSFIIFSAGILALLDENEDQLRVFALERLNEITDTFWPEIADSIQKM